MYNEYEVEAQVHKPVAAGYRVKALVYDLGLYINGMMVFPPNEEHDWSVYPPLLGWAGRGKYRYTVEFDKSAPLWNEISDACINAVKAWMESNDRDVDSKLARPLERRDYENKTSTKPPYKREKKFM